MKKTFGRRAPRPEARKAPEALRALLELFLENAQEDEKSVGAAGMGRLVALSASSIGERRDGLPRKGRFGGEMSFSAYERNDGGKKEALEPDGARKAAGDEPLFREEEEASPMKRDKSAEKEGKGQGNKRMNISALGEDAARKNGKKLLGVEKRRARIARIIAALIDGDEMMGEDLLGLRRDPQFANALSRLRFIEEI